MFRKITSTNFENILRPLKLESAASNVETWQFRSTCAGRRARHSHGARTRAVHEFLAAHNIKTVREKYVDLQQTFVDSPRTRHRTRSSTVPVSSTHDRHVLLSAFVGEDRDRTLVEFGKRISHNCVRMVVKKRCFHWVNQEHGQDSAVIEDMVENESMKTLFE